MNDTPQIKRGPGRPRKVKLEREELREPVKTNKWNMKATPNWEVMDPSLIDSPDRLYIDPSEIPDGMSLLWVTGSIYGQEQTQRRGMFERKGWTPVHQSDFDGRFDGRFMSRGKEGEITVDCCVLMARPKAMTDKARLEEQRRAIQQVVLKEEGLLSGGGIPITLDAKHKSAVNSNRISRTVERIEIPE